MNRRTPTVRRASTLRRFGTDSDVANSLPRHWYRGDTYTLSGGNLSTLPNRGSAGGSLTVTSGTLAAPAASSALSGRLAVTFTATQRMRSSLAAAAFDFMHNGGPATIACIYVPTSVTGSQIPWSTCPAANAALENGLWLQSSNAGLLGRGAASNASLLFNLSGGTLTINTAAGVLFSYLEGGTPEGSLSLNGSSVSTGASGVAPSAGTASSAFTLGSGSGGAAPANMLWADLLIYDRILSGDELSRLSAYSKRTYGARLL